MGEEGGRPGDVYAKIFIGRIGGINKKKVIEKIIENNQIFPESWTIYLTKNLLLLLKIMFWNKNGEDSCQAREQTNFCCQC